MTKEQFDKEWDFIIQEVHGSKSTKENRVQRELLLMLQQYLSIDNIELYSKIKDLYLSNTLCATKLYEEKFCAEILEVFEKNNINGHIEWKK
jgi:hypothetical protein